MLARFVGGLSKGNISLSMAIITDVSDMKNRGKAMALVGIAFSIGFIIGPMIGALFSIYTDKTTSMWFWYPASFAFLLSLADILFIYRFFNESLPKVIFQNVHQHNTLFIRMINDLIQMIWIVFNRNNAQNKYSVQFDKHSITLALMPYLSNCTLFLIFWYFQLI